MRVLLIEDEVDMAETLGAALSKEGFNVAVANDVSTALALSRDLKPDMVVSDIEVQTDSGIELCHQIAREQPGCKIVLMSGSKEFADFAELATKKGLKGCILRKPFSLQTFCRTIRDYMNGIG